MLRGLTLDKPPRERFELFPGLNQKTSRGHLDGDLFAAVSRPDVQSRVLQQCRQASNDSMSKGHWTGLMGKDLELTRDFPWMVKKFISEWNLSRQLLNTRSSLSGMLVCSCTHPAKILSKDSEAAPEDRALVPKSQLEPVALHQSATHSPAFPYLRKSVAVGANKCDLNPGATISFRVQKVSGMRRV